MTRLYLPCCAREVGLWAILQNMRAMYVLTLMSPACVTKKIGHLLDILEHQIVRYHWEILQNVALDLTNLTQMLPFLISRAIDLYIECNEDLLTISLHQWSVLL